MQYLPSSTPPTTAALDPGRLTLEKRGSWQVYIGQDPLGERSRPPAGGRLGS